MNDWRSTSKREWMERAIAAEQRAEAAEAKLLQVDTFGIDQWKRGAHRWNVQSFKDWLHSRDNGIITQQPSA